MSKQQRRRLAHAAAVLVVGLAIGFWPRTMPSYSIETDVSCGSVFLPSNSPGGHDSAELRRDCHYALRDVRSLAIVVTALGGVPLAFLLLRMLAARDAKAAAAASERSGAGDGPTAGTLLLSFFMSKASDSYGKANAAVLTSQSPAPATRAVADEGATESTGVDQEDYWRSQGWAPASETEGPPPGWGPIEPDGAR
jgi:hypothetical protein